MPLAARNREMVAAFLDGAGYAAIGREYGVSRQRARAIVTAFLLAAGVVVSVQVRGGKRQVDIRQLAEVR